MYIIYNHKEETFPFGTKVFDTFHDALCRIADSVDIRMLTRFEIDEYGSVYFKKPDAMALRLDILKRIWPAFANLLIYDIEYDRVLYPTAFYWQIQKLLCEGYYYENEPKKVTHDNNFRRGPAEGVRKHTYRYGRNARMGRKSIGMLTDPELKEYQTSRDRKRVINYTLWDDYYFRSSKSWKDRTKNRNQWAVHKKRCKTSKTGRDYSDFLDAEYENSVLRFEGYNADDIYQELLDIAYQAYREKWCEARGYSLYEVEQADELDMEYNGEMYVCKGEFEYNEFEDAEYMYQLLGDTWCEYTQAYIDEGEESWWK